VFCDREKGGGTPQGFTNFSKPGHNSVGGGGRGGERLGRISKLCSLSREYSASLFRLLTALLENLTNFSDI